MKPLVRRRKLASRVEVARDRAWLGRLAWLATLCGLGSGCSARAELPRVVVTHAGLAIDGVGDGEDRTLTARVRLPAPGALDLPDGIDAALWVRSLTATAEAGVSDLSFVHRVTLSIVSGDGDDTRARTLIDQRRVEGRSSGMTLTVPAEGDVEVLELLRTESPVYELTLGGHLPEDDWRLSVAITFEGRLSVELADRL